MFAMRSEGVAAELELTEGVPPPPTLEDAVAEAQGEAVSSAKLGVAGDVERGEDESSAVEAGVGVAPLGGEAVGGPVARAEPDAEALGGAEGERRALPDTEGEPDEEGERSEEREELREGCCKTLLAPLTEALPCADGEAGSVGVARVLWDSVALGEGEGEAEGACCEGVAAEGSLGEAVAQELRVARAGDAEGICGEGVGLRKNVGQLATGD